MSSTFAELGLSPSLLEALGDMGLVTPTSIQASAIPALLGEPRDFIGLAQTGTGKTAAFGLPLLQHIDPSDDRVQAVVMSPTRELCQQIAQQLEAFSAHQARVNVLVVYGGAAIEPQMRALRRPVHVVVATPGRLNDLLRRKAIHLDTVRFFVLDEADEMLNMGFREEIDAILEYTHSGAVTWLFSATMPAGIRHIVGTYMKDPLEITIEKSQRVNENIEHQYAVVKAKNKLAALTRFIDNFPSLYGVVFCRTKIGAQEVASGLMDAGYPADAIHGDLSQSQRNQVMRRFKSGQTPLLIATDVAARGIDVNDLTHVVHYDLPSEAEGYTHRSGRTARAGKKGISLALVSRAEEPKLKRIEKTLRVTIQPVSIPTIEQVMTSRAARWAEGLATTASTTPVPPAILERVNTILAHLDRTQLLERLLSLELGKMSTRHEIPSSDLNLTPAAMPRTSDGGPVAGQRFFINAGHMDQIQKGDLLRMICEQTGLSKAEVGAIDMREKHSFFELIAEDVARFEESFKGLFLRGRPIRVNRDQFGTGTSDHGSSDQGSSGPARHTKRPRESKDRGGQGTRPRGTGYRKDHKAKKFRP